MKKILLYLFLFIVLAKPVLAQDLIIESEGRILSIYKNCRNFIRINPNVYYYKTNNGIISQNGEELLANPSEIGKCQILGKDKITGKRDTLLFDVISLPSPKFGLSFSNSGRVDFNNFFLRPRMQLNAYPDRTLELLMPKEARYYPIEEYKIDIFNNDSLINTQVISGNVILADEVYKLGAKRRSKVIITPTKVYRLGSNGKKYLIENLEDSSISLRLR